MNYSERIDKIFGHSNSKYRTLRTLFDPASNEWNETTMEKKIEILTKILEHYETLWTLLLEYQLYYTEINKTHVVKEVQTGLAYLLENILTQYELVPKKK